MWALHCHLVWHMAARLLMQFSSLLSKLAELDVLQDIVAQCSAMSIANKEIALQPLFTITVDNPQKSVGHHLTETR